MRFKTCRSGNWYVGWRPQCSAQQLVNKWWYRTCCIVCTTPKSPKSSVKNMQSSGQPFKAPVVHRAQWAHNSSAERKLQSNFIHHVQYKYTSFPVNVWYAMPAVLYRGADKSLAQPGRNQATATEGFTTRCSKSHFTERVKHFFFLFFLALNFL